MRYLTVSDVIDFLCEHKTAEKDFCAFFGIDIDDIESAVTNLEADKVLSWLLDHEILACDFLAQYGDGITVNDAFTIDLEEVAEKLADRMQVLH